MMDQNQIRNMVKDLYPNSPVWKRKVDRMEDVQVFAIYKRVEEEREELQKIQPYEQGTLF